MCSFGIYTHYNQHGIRYYKLVTYNIRNNNSSNLDVFSICKILYYEIEIVEQANPYCISHIRLVQYVTGLLN